MFYFSYFFSTLILTVTSLQMFVNETKKLFFNLYTVLLLICFKEYEEVYDDLLQFYVNVNY